MKIKDIEINDKLKNNEKVLGIVKICTKRLDHIKKYKFKNIDEKGVVNHKPHNPLTINTEMKKLGFIVEDLYFYHYHPLPPLFENFDKIYYRKNFLFDNL